MACGEIRWSSTSFRISTLLMVERLNISGCDAAMGCRSEVGAKERRKNLMAVEARVQKQ
jgi:hypothetical protein